jgi:hypothetical protein
MWRGFLVMAFCGAMVGTVAAGEKYGVLAETFLTLSARDQGLYLAGVMDSMDLLGIRCPTSVDVSYPTIARDTATLIRSYPERWRTSWTAEHVLIVLYGKGCRRE